MELISNSVEKTQSIASQLVRELLKNKPAKRLTASVVALTGELGAGKTTFIQGLSGALGLPEKVLSPTFLIMHQFELPKEQKPFQALHHIDLYRLSEPTEILDLGLEEILANPQNLVVIEWADRFPKLIPKNAIWVKLEWLGEDKRRISVI